jgi:hypothetical protein
MIVAEITKDHLYATDPGTWSEPPHSYVGKRFEYQAMREWWGWNDLSKLPLINDLTPTPFKLYDDDGELYYEGWLINDNECIVQQFVLAWAMADSGCTVIKVQAHHGVGYVQEIV